MLRDTDPAAPVPSCPEWTAHDLLHHMTGVALFWGAIVHDRLRDPSAAEAAEETRPAGHDDLFPVLERATGELIADLERTPDEVAVWTWSDDHTVGFIRRRMAHEVVIHRLDAELAADAVTPIDAGLAADGVHEALQHFYGGFPPWSTHTSGRPDRAHHRHRHRRRVARPHRPLQRAQPEHRKDLRPRADAGTRRSRRTVLHRHRDGRTARRLDLEPPGVQRPDQSLASAPTSKASAP